MMNRISQILYFLMTIVISSCGYNQSVNKDFVTGAYSHGKGVSCNDVRIEVQGKNDNRNEFVAGEKVELIFNNVIGLDRVDDKVFPGMSMSIIKNEQETVLEKADLFADLEDGTDLSPLQLIATFSTILPHKDNEKYKVLVNIWDKKGDATFQYELPFTIKENNLLKIDNQSLSYKAIYLWDDAEKLMMINKEIGQAKTYFLLSEGIEGLEVIDNKVYPALSIDISDNKGKTFLSSANIFEEQRSTGIDYETFKNSQLPVSIKFSSEQVQNPCTLKASITDLKSDRRIDINGELVII